MAMPMFWLCVLSSFVYSVNCFNDSLIEDLYIRPLQSGQVYSHFEFKTLWNTSREYDNYFEHFRLFPKALGEVLKQWGVEELHLSQTQGTWRWDEWGYPMQGAPSGAELWVWFHKDTLNVDKAWKNLINILSGMFCASLNFMDASNTVTPKWSYRPEGVSSHGGFRGYLRYAALPREIVCTENLTPWKKLLPCAAKSGLGVLFNALRLYDSSYVSLGVHFRSLCLNEKTSRECSDLAVELRQTLSVVFDPLLSSKSQDWSLKKMYNRMIANVCPLAATTTIYVDQTQNKNEEYYFTLNPEPQVTETFMTSEGQRAKVAIYHVEELVGYNRILNIAAKYNKNLERRPVKPPMVYAHQYQTGYGQEYGGVLCLVHNHHTEPVSVLYMQALPWYLRMYIHTLSVNHFPINSHMTIGRDGNSTKPKFTNYVPGRDHQQPYFLEITLTLPPNSVTRLAFDFDRALLKWTEYPPDANHGFYVNSAVITTPLTPIWRLPAENSDRLKSFLSRFSQSSVLRIHTEHMLVTLPTPDFSMPYNVICLACTVVAIAFGSIHNLTTRRFVIKDPKKHKSFLGKLKALLRKDTSDEKVETLETDNNVGTSNSGDVDTPVVTKKKTKTSEES